MDASRYAQMGALAVYLMSFHASTANYKSMDNLSELAVYNPVATARTLPGNSSRVLVIDPATGEPVSLPSNLAPSVNSPPTTGLPDSSVTIATPPTPSTALRSVVTGNGTVAIILDDSYLSPLRATVRCTEPLDVNTSNTKNTDNSHCTTAVRHGSASSTQPSSNQHGISQRASNQVNSTQFNSSQLDNIQIESKHLDNTQTLNSNLVDAQ